MRVLVVTAVAVERDAVLRGVCGARGGAPVAADIAEVAGPGFTARCVEGRPRYDVLAAGVGPAASAAGASAALAAAALDGQPYGLAVSAGVGGGFEGVAPVGSLVVAEEIVAADLGADTSEGFLPLAELGFGRGVHLPPRGLAAALADATGAAFGPVLTVSTVTGTAAHAGELVKRHPKAAAEAMEGFGVAEAATAHGVPVLEIRAVSNAVGPRDRASWRLPEALEALAGAFGTLGELLAAGEPTTA